MFKEDDARAMRTKVFFEEFRFMENYMNPVELDEPPKVARIDLDLLDQKANSYLGETSRYFLLDKDGDEVGEVQEGRWRLFKPSIPSESVLDALRRTGAADRVHFILHIYDRGADIRSDKRRVGKIMPYGITATICKVPSEWKLDQWLDHLKDHARAKLKKDLERIDNTNGH